MICSIGLRQGAAKAYSTSPAVLASWRGWPRSAGMRGGLSIDLNTAMLAVARTKSATIEWVEGSALNLPFEANIFDVALCQLGLQFFPHRWRSGKWCGCSSRGGRAGLSVYSAIEQTPAAHAFVQALDKYLGSESSRTKRSEHLSCKAQEVGRGQEKPASTLSMWRPLPNKSRSHRCWTMSAFSLRQRQWPHS
jgi:hypothetical protein